MARNETENNGVFVQSHPQSVFAESIRALRTNLQYTHAQGKLRSLLVTSVGPEEGKSVITSNLAASFALAGISTIVVGADLRKPSLHHYFQISNAKGLTNVLIGQLSLEDTLIQTDIPNLRLLPSGPIPPNPAELLGSDAMQLVLSDIEDACSLVIFDAPPTLAVTDASLLASHVSGTLVVINMSNTNRDMAIRARDQLYQVNANILGFVANRADEKESTAGYYSYYGVDQPATSSSRVRPGKNERSHHASTHAPMAGEKNGHLLEKEPTADKPVLREVKSDR